MVHLLKQWNCFQRNYYLFLETIRLCTTASGFLFSSSLFSLTYKFTVINLFLCCLIKCHPQFTPKAFIQESFSLAAKFFISNLINIFTPTILASVNTSRTKMKKSGDSRHSYLVPLWISQGFVTFPLIIICAFFEVSVNLTYLIKLSPRFLFQKSKQEDCSNF